jgi:hypothetical protein
MILLLWEKHVLWTDGTRTFYLDEVTWIVAGLSVAWLVSFFVNRYLRRRALRRPRRRNNSRSLKRIARIKRKLSSQYLSPGFSGNIHAVGIGRLAGSNDYCIQVFINNAAEELWPGAAALPNSYRSVPVVLIEMPVAGFLSRPTAAETAPNPYPSGIREPQDIIIGGISGANTNLTGQSGTIGYLCTRKSKLRRRKEIHLLSNSHVFADLRRATVDDTDLIMQPSPGEPASTRPIAKLVDFSALKFASDIKDPNYIDAAIAKLWEPQQHNPVIPMIGTVKGHVTKEGIEVGEPTRKFGRTTGYTEGRIFSIDLDIWIRYDRTGQSAFFQGQILIEPAAPKYAKFVAKGDSGSLLVDENQHAIGLIFAGVAELPESLVPSPSAPADVQTVPATEKAPRIEGYGVANPITEVLDRLRIDLLV